MRQASGGLVASRTPTICRPAVVLLALALGVPPASGDDGPHALPDCASPPRRCTVTVLHTNDLHGHLEPWVGWEGRLAGVSVGGMARVATHVRDIRAEVGARRVLLLDGGDTLGDTMLAGATRGTAMIDVMNAIRYDAMVVGNHEPDFGADVLRQRIRDAQFAVLASNIRSRDGGLLARPYFIKEVGGINVGVIGLAYPNTALTTAKRNVDGLRFADATSSARRYVPMLRRAGADIVVALTHLGLGADIALAKSVRGIDLIVGGHSHNRMHDALQVGDTLIVQAGAHGSDLGRIDLVVERGRIASFARSLIAIDTSVVPDPDIAAIIDRHRDALAPQLSEHLGHARAPIPRAQTLAGQEPRKRDQQSPADLLFADALRATTGTQIAFLPGVGYGVALPAGDITAQQLRNLIPHDSAVWTMTLRGKQIREVLEQSVENVTTRDPSKRVGGMIQVSGLRFGYDASAPRGKRVRDIQTDAGPLLLSASYEVAVNGLLAQGGHNYRAFVLGSDRVHVGDQYDLVKSWIAGQAAVAPPAESRITGDSARASERTPARPPPVAPRLARSPR